MIVLEYTPSPEEKKIAEKYLVTNKTPPLRGHTPGFITYDDSPFLAGADYKSPPPRKKK